MEETKSEFQITPETKIGALLDRYPGLEKTLLEMAPEFKKLRNPILRKTIAKVTSLRQAATIAKIPVAEMINRLRSEAGIQEEYMTDDSIMSFSAESPSWFSTSRIVESLDARSMLDKGEQPINKVVADCKNLKVGEIYELITPFLPVPLVEMAKKQGFLVWSKEEKESVFKTYLTPET